MPSPNSICNRLYRLPRSNRLNKHSFRLFVRTQRGLAPMSVAPRNRTSSNAFHFKAMTIKIALAWAQCCSKAVYNDIPGPITKEDGWTEDVGRERKERVERENNFHVIQRAENDQLNVWAMPPFSSLYAKISRRISEFVKRENPISVRAKSSVYPASNINNSAARTA